MVGNTWALSIIDSSAMVGVMKEGSPIELINPGFSVICLLAAAFYGENVDTILKILDAEKIKKWLV